MEGGGEETHFRSLDPPSNAPPPAFLTVLFSHYHAGYRTLNTVSFGRERGREYKKEGMLLATQHLGRSGYTEGSREREGVSAALGVKGGKGLDPQALLVSFYLPRIIM